MARLHEPGHRRPLDRNRVLVLAVVLVVALFALWAITTGAIRLFGGDDEKNPTTAQPRPSAQPTAGSTTAVTDGDLEMRLVSVRPTGPRELTITLTVTNRTTAFVSFYGESQQVVSDTSTTARGNVSLTSLEPRESARVTLVFALPADFRATELDLHAAPASPGAHISLG